MITTYHPFYWHNNTQRRYQILQSKNNQKKKKIIENTITITPEKWYHLDKIILHSSSNKVLTNSDLYSSLNLALSCAGAQSAYMLKSKQSLSAFKVIKGSVSGASVTLRQKYMFCYKWNFLSASEGITQTKLMSKSTGISNIFIFPELDQLDYTAFEPISGLNIEFVYS